MGLQLLGDPDEWTRYKTAFAAENGMDPNQMQWGDGPGGYPCIVASVMKNETTVLSCYIFPEEARLLCETAGFIVADPHMVEKVGGAIGPDQEEFNRSAAAHLGALISFAIKTGLANEKTYEAEYIRQLSDVEQWGEADKRRAMAQLHKGMSPATDTGIGDPDAS
jgi:hypothetical protein